MKFVRYADRPDRREIRYDELSIRTFPEFLHHNAMGWRYWDRLYEDHPDFQLALLDEDGLVAELHSLPGAWDVTVADLPSGWDESFERSYESGRPADALYALAISVLPERQGQRLSSALVGKMVDLAREHGLRAVAAPVRPTLKAQYPLIPIERYVAWRRDDGSHFDPWLRLHERVGGKIVTPAPESMTIDAPVAEWEEWTGVAMPEDGAYVVPGALAPVFVRDGMGRHLEPNVWVIHEARAKRGPAA